jgi:hypothetical protein
MMKRVVSKNYLQKGGNGNGQCKRRGGSILAVTDSGYRRCRVLPRNKQFKKGGIIMHVDLSVYQDIVNERLEKVKNATYGQPTYRKRKKNKPFKSILSVLLKR